MVQRSLGILQDSSEPGNAIWPQRFKSQLGVVHCGLVQLEWLVTILLLYCQPYSRVHFDVTLYIYSEVVISRAATGNAWQAHCLGCCVSRIMVGSYYVSRLAGQPVAGGLAGSWFQCKWEIVGMGALDPTIRSKVSWFAMYIHWVLCILLWYVIQFCVFHTQ